MSGNRRKTILVSAALLSSTLLMTACQSGDDDAQAPATATPAGSTPAPSGASANGGSQGSGNNSAGKTSGGSNTGGKGSTTGGGASTGGTGGGTGKSTFCKTQDLAIDATNAAPDKTSGRINITMVNRGSTTCSATGFAGVDIKDADHTSNPIERGPAQPRVTTLKPGDAAVFDLAYTIDSSGHSLAHPTNILVTPPNETHSVTLNWPTGAGQIKGAYTDVQVYPTHTTD
ncbi:DUF4232 domain-containing protein [Streptomyces violascens]|uniref:DUF4232 domain-containing protein n=1 Tax=Streptomyces violascens TaxID=67381 RepID=UPI003798CB48